MLKGLNVTLSTAEQDTEPDVNIQAQITVAFYVIVAVFCLVTNIILNYLLFTRKYMRIKYIFTASISISHIMISVVVLPLAISVLITNKLMDDAQSVTCDVMICFCVGVTSYSMIATAIRRCLAISERFRHANFTYRGKVKNIVFIWVFALVTSVPYIFKEDDIVVFSFVSNGNINSSAVYDENSVSSNTSYTLLVQPNVTESTAYNSDSNTSVTQAFYIYNVVLFFLQMIIPCTTSLVLQFFTLLGLKRRPNQIHWVKEIKITKQHIYMAAIFLLCWLPLMLINIIAAHTLVPGTVFHILQPFAVSSIMFFPVIYYALNAHIRREFLLLIQNLTNR